MTQSNCAVGSSAPMKGGRADNFDDDEERIEAAIFFLRCQKWMMKKYVDEIRTSYLKPLVELCGGKRQIIESVSDPIKDAATRGANDAQKVENVENSTKIIARTDQIAQKLQQALKSLQQDDRSETTQSYRPVARNKVVSLADCCAMYRLKELLKALEELLDIQGSLDKWFENNKAKMIVRKGIFKNVLNNALTNFEMAYVITELFAVEPVTKKKIQEIKPQYAKYIRPDDGSRSTFSINKPFGEGVTTREYIKKLEGQINHFRTVVYETAKNIEIIIGIIVANDCDHRLEVNTKQVTLIIDNLPPRYRFPETISLSPFSKKLLANPPPNSNRNQPFNDFFDNSYNDSTKSTSLTQSSKAPQSGSRGNHRAHESRKKNTVK